MIALSVLTSSCVGQYPAKNVKTFTVPEQPELPTVEFTTVTDPTRAACLDPENIKALLLRDTLIENYIQQLEVTIKYCK